MEKGKKMVAVLVDLRAAFDSQRKDRKCPILMNF